MAYRVAPSRCDNNNNSKNVKTNKIYGNTQQQKKENNLQCSFSSRFPLDVTDNARMNSSNSIDPSFFFGFVEYILSTTYTRYEMNGKRRERKKNK